MPASTATITVGTNWSADLAGGASSVLIQRRTSALVIIYVGASAPAADNVEGIRLGDDRDVFFGAPAFAAGDKIFAKAPEGSVQITVVKS